MVGARAHAEAVEDRASSSDPLGGRHARKGERQRDVVDDAEAGKQVERLEDHADTLAAVSCQGDLVQLREVLTVDTHRSAGRPLEAGDDVEQSGLPGTGRAHYGHELAAPNSERDAGERCDGRPAGCVGALEVQRLDGQRSVHCGQVCPMRATIPACG